MSPKRTLLTSADIITFHEAVPHASWMLIENGLVLDIGDGPLPRVGDDVSVTDLHGKVVIPGLIDGHTHLELGGALGNGVYQLPVGIESVESLAEELAHAAKATAQDSWVIAASVSSRLLGQLDSIESLTVVDRATGAVPVLLRDETYHNRFVNSAAMAKVQSFEFSGGGEISHDRGQRTGVFREHASTVVELAAQADRRGNESTVSALRTAMELHNSYGVTTVQDASTTLTAWRALQQMAVEGFSSVRVIASMLFNDPGFGADPTGLELLERTQEPSHPLVQRRFAKIFLDGVPSSHTAAYHEPYRSLEGDNRGVLNFSTETLSQALLSLGTHDLGAKIHVLGDRAVSVAIQSVHTAREEGYTMPVQLAHAKNITSNEIATLHELDIAIDASPPAWHPSSITQAVADELGRDIAYFRSPHRTMLDAGVKLAGGTDWPVVASPSPWFGIESMVTRRDPTGTYPGALWPEQSITVREALHAHTAGAAEALGVGDVTGQIAPGLSADFAILDRNPLTTEPSLIHDTHVLATYLRGEPVYVRNNREGSNV